MSNAYDDMRLKGLAYLEAVYGEDAVERAIDNIVRFEVEVPAWQLWSGFGGGGRFDAGGLGGAARTTAEIASDVGMIHKLTGSAPEVSFHVLWTFSDDGITPDYTLAEKAKEELAVHDLEMGAVNTTFFLAGSDDGSFTSQDAATRERYTEQTVFAAKVAAKLGNGLVSLWWPDGTNYPGQRNLQDKIGLMRDSVIHFWERVPEDIKEKLDRVLFEYKVFEPGTYSTTIPDWGTAFLLSQLLGDKGAVLVDMGHHHHGTNIEQIVANLIAFGIRGGFHFNTRYAADDDHSVQADYEMARIFNELIQGDVLFNPDPAKNWTYALDQMARTERRIPSVIKSIEALKLSVAKASLVDIYELSVIQKEQDLIKANVMFEQALLAVDVRPILMEAYTRQGLHPVPLVAYDESGYQEKIETERV